MSAEPKPVQGLSLTDPRCAEVLEALPGLAPASAAPHTPGPWKAFEKDGKHVQADEWSTDCEGSRTSTHAPIKAGSKVVALVVASARHWPDLPDISPNCHLIAAAPELLDFAKWLLEAYRSDSGMYEPKFIARKARELISKATGGAA